MKHIFHTIRHTARAATVLLLALLAAQTAGAQMTMDVSTVSGFAAAFGNTNVSEINVDADITGVGNLPPLYRALTIKLNGHTISGDGLHIDVYEGCSLTINGGGQDGSVGNIIRGNADRAAIDNFGTVTLRNVNIITYHDNAIEGPGTLNIGDNVSFKYISDIDNASGLVAAFGNTNVSVINVTDNITGVGDLSSINRALTINLNGHTISGDGLHFNVDPYGSLTINGEGQDGSVGNIISGYAIGAAINSEGTVTLSHVNITTNSAYAIGGNGMLYIGNNVSFNGWTERPFITTKINIIEGANYNSIVVATVTVESTDHYFENLGAALVYIAKHPDTTLVTPDLSADFSWSGDTYTIHTDTGWGYFCDMLEAGETFSGKTVELANDITVTRMAGGQPFTGTFDGQNHKLTLAYGTADAPVDAQFVAPFVETARDTSPVFRNLTIDGTIYATHTAATDHDHVGGLIGHLFGDVTIEHCVSRVEIHAKGGAGGFVGLCEHSVSFTDCHSAAVVHSADGSNSGFVAWSRDSGWEINFTGCLFDGKLLQQNGTGHSNGGFIGWKGDAKTVNITNCLCAPAPLADGEMMAKDGSATFSREHSNYPATIKNSYYTQTLGAAQGKQARAVTAGTDVTVAHAGVATHYATSGITAYKATGASTDIDPFIAGLLYNNNVVDVLYAGSDEVVSLTLSNTATGAPDGYQYGYTASAGTLEGSTLTMPNQDVTVSVNTDALTVLPWSGDGSKGSPYIIEYPSQLDLLAYRINGTHGETCQAKGYYDTYFQLANDISYPHKADGEEGADAENNYEAIGGYYGGYFRYFRGHFDGGGNTISGIRIYKGGNDDADNYQGIFGRTDGADIHDLTLADARITGYQFTGGIVGFNGGTVSGCHVAGDVAVCAVQSRAYSHGGIAGFNDGGGTIKQCTSAATLTTAYAANSMYYGGIAGYNLGTLRDNLAFGATVPAAADNSYGAITGDNYNIGTLLRNYYAACNVADTENATGVGCGYIGNDDDGYTTADVTANNGAVSIHTLTLADGITTSTPVTVTIGTTGYYAQGTAIALSYSGTPDDAPLGYRYDGYTASAGTISGSTLTMPADDVTVSFGLRSTGVAVRVSYVDAGGTAQKHDAIALDGTETGLGEGWYFVCTDIAFDHTLDLSSDVHLILADGCTMNITSNGNGIDVNGSLTIYGQTDGTGTLNATSENDTGICTDGGTITICGGTVTTTGDNEDIHSENGNITISGGTVTATGGNGGIHSESGNITISGGTVTATGGGDGIFTYGGTITISGGRVTATGGTGINNYGGTITISGGTVTATSDNGYGIYTDGGTITISGGRVTATGNYGIYIYSSGTITLGCTTASDFIYASSYGVGSVGRLNIADGQTLYDEDGIFYSGNGVTIPAGKTLRPGLTARQAPDGNYWTTYYNSDSGFTIGAEENACAYTATYGDGQLTLHKLGKEIPAGTAVIIVADNDVVSMATTTLPPYYGPTNNLRGVDDDTQTSTLGTGTFYVLGMTTVNGKQHFGFHRYTGEEMAAHKAYVLVDNSQARSLTMVFDDATGIESLTPDAAPKAQAADHWFTLDGRRLQAKPTAPGIYVNNGRKVMIK